MKKTVVAFDFGASSGRAIAGTYQDVRLEYKEVHRFDNIPVDDDGHMCHNFPAICKEVDAALSKINSADGLSFDIFRQVDVTAPVIFTTAFDQYAVQAFKYNSFDYLLKPIDADELAAAIDDAFGSFDKFRGQFTAAANGLQGSGWAVLGYDSLGGKLLTFQLYDQQANVPLGIIPLLQVDMWEHAF